MPHIRMGHVARMNASCPMKEWERSRDLGSAKCDALE